jgi:hypothetical protein
MPWQNAPLMLYHGTSEDSYPSINRGIDFTCCDPITDFGLGFYTTTNLQQAKNWANLVCRRAAARPGARAKRATVIEFNVDRDFLAQLDVLFFITEISSSDYWDFVTFHRHSGGLHRPSGKVYDVVCGPVSLWPQTHVIKDCDQISFHTSSAASALKNPTVIYQANFYF